MARVKSASHKKDNTANEAAVGHLEELRREIRDEIKLRIKQRDQYAIQLTIALSALVAVSATTSSGFTSTITSPNNSAAVSVVGFAHRAIVAAPLVTIYFTTLILYSYRIHGLLTSYLKKEIEPELARLCGVSSVKEWETYYQSHANPGIRKTFFVLTLWIVCITTPLYIGYAEGWQGGFLVPLVALTAIYLCVALWTTFSFWKE